MQQIMLHSAQTLFKLENLLLTGAFTICVTVLPSPYFAYQQAAILCPNLKQPKHLTRFCPFNFVRLPLLPCIRNPDDR